MTLTSLLRILIAISLIACHNSFVIQPYKKVSTFSRNQIKGLTNPEKNLNQYSNDRFSRSYMQPESAPVSDSGDDWEAQVKKEGKIKALWNKYGPLYFQVWFCIYLPFLISFFLVLDNNLLQSSSFTAGFDPKAFVFGWCKYIEDITGDPQLMSGIKENPRAITFATGKKTVIIFV
jgi:hypothetical protein